MDELLCPLDDTVCVAVQFFEVDIAGSYQDISRETNITPNEPLSTITRRKMQRWLEQSANVEFAWVFGPSDRWKHRPFVEYDAGGQACLIVCAMKSLPCLGPHLHAQRGNRFTFHEFMGYLLLDAAYAGCYRCVRLLIEYHRVPVSFQSRTQGWTALRCLDEKIQEYHGSLSLQDIALRDYLIDQEASPEYHP